MHIGKRICIQYIRMCILKRAYMHFCGENYIGLGFKYYSCAYYNHMSPYNTLHGLVTKEDMKCSISQRKL